MRRILWDDYSPLWEQEVRRRPLKEIFEEMMAPGSHYRVPASYMHDYNFLGKIVASYVGGDPGPWKFYESYEHYGLGDRIMAGNLYSLLLLHGIVLSPEKLEGMTEYRTRDGTVYRCGKGKNEVIRSNEQNLQ